jgi:hypothetical protein
LRQLVSDKEDLLKIRNITKNLRVPEATTSIQMRFISGYKELKKTIEKEDFTQPSTARIRQGC